MSENPWISIWVHPRATIRKIITENPNRNLVLLAAIYGFTSLLNLFQSASIGRVTGGTSLIILIGIVLSPIWGYIFFAVWSGFVTWTGKWFKGQGNFTTIRAAYAWSCVPLTINIFLWVVLMWLFGNQLFLNFPDAYPLQNTHVYLLFAILLIKIVISIWSLIIYLNALAEVQQYSIYRAVGNVVVSGILISVVLTVFWTLFLYLLDLQHIGVYSE